MDYKVVLGLAAIAAGIAGYIPYFWTIFKGQTKPHMFSWLVWFLLEAIAFFALLSAGAGPGAWVLGVTAVLCFCVFILSIKRGEKNITTVDRLSFVGALLGVALWILTKNPLSAVILITITDFLGFVPTFRKSYNKPYDENIALYGLSFLKQIFSVMALASYKFTVILYPASLVLTNAVFAIMVLIRRKSIIKQQA